MKLIKYGLLLSGALCFSLAQGQNNVPKSYRLTFEVENEGKNVGGWTKDVLVTTSKNASQAIIVDIVSPKKVIDKQTNYEIGFNIKSNILRKEKTKNGYEDYLSLMANYATLQKILYDTTQEKSLASGEIVQSQLKNTNEVLNSITFIKLYDITQPLNKSVPFARFVLVEKGNKSLVVLKFKVEKNYN